MAGGVSSRSRMPEARLRLANYAKSLQSWAARDAYRTNAGSRLAVAKGC
jgi:hypothetical protein